jgi:CheY-like chemotaxis protein
MKYLPVKKKSRILVVQDDPVLLGLVSGSLRPEGHDIIERRSPLEALVISAGEYQRIDLVVAEIDSRPMSGLELANRLSRKGIDVPILFMSASHGLAAVIARSLGQSSVIEEPFTGDQLRSSVKKCLAGQRRKPRPD